MCHNDTLPVVIGYYIVMRVIAVINLISEIVSTCMCQEASTFVNIYMWQYLQTSVVFIHPGPLYTNLLCSIHSLFMEDHVVCIAQCYSVK